MYHISSLFQQHSVLGTVFIAVLRITEMADEPSELIDRVIDAHECNGDREGLACENNSDSEASICDGTSETVTAAVP